MMLTNRNKMIVALLLAAVVAFTAYTMYAKSCACKKAAAVAADEASKKAPKIVMQMPDAVVSEKAVAEKETDIPKPVLA